MWDKEQERKRHEAARQERKRARDREFKKMAEEAGRSVGDLKEGYRERIREYWMAVYCTRFFPPHTPAPIFHTIFPCSPRTSPLWRIFPHFGRMFIPYLHPTFSPLLSLQRCSV